MRDRTFLNGYEDPSVGEGTTPIWITMETFAPWHYYHIGMYWSAQVVGRLGFGDINVHGDLHAFVLIFVMVICSILTAVTQSLCVAMFIQYDDGAHEKSKISFQRNVRDQTHFHKLAYSI